MIAHYFLHLWSMVKQQQMTLLDLLCFKGNFLELLVSTYYIIAELSCSTCIEPLYAELSEGVMSYHVKLYHEHNLQKVYYYIENCTSADLSVTTVS